jgi:hypothetical protein
VFALEFLDPVCVVDALMVAQIVFVGEFSFTRWTLIGSLFDRQMYGEVDVENGLTDGSIGTEVTRVGIGWWHGLGVEAACGRVSELVDFVEMASEAARLVNRLIHKGHWWTCGRCVCVWKARWRGS